MHLVRLNIVESCIFVSAKCKLIILKKKTDVFDQLVKIFIQDQPATSLKVWSCLDAQTRILYSAEE